MKLSIIIPYYDTLEYTMRLLKVLEKQMRPNVEVIVIDDGCQERNLEAFDFIKLIHLNKNYGASHAWNVGIKEAKGEYIGFIDSDDMITPNYISTLLYAIEKEHTDEIVFNYWLKRGDKNLLMSRPETRAIWKAIYKRWLVPWFDESIKCRTDVPFERHILTTEHSKSFVPIELYYYTLHREGSITWKKERKMFKEDEYGK